MMDKARKAEAPGARQHSKWPSLISGTGATVLLFIIAAYAADPFRGIAFFAAMGSLLSFLLGALAYAFALVAGTDRPARILIGTWFAATPLFGYLTYLLFLYDS